MIVCPFHVNNGRVHCKRLVSIVLYWHGLWHKMCNVKCMIHFDLRCAYYHFKLLIRVYKMFLSLRQAFQGLTLNGSFVYMKCWNLENINVLKTPSCFWGRKETEYLSVIVDNGTLRLTPDTFVAVRNWLLPKTQKHIKSFIHFFSYGSCI